MLYIAVEYLNIAR